MKITEKEILDEIQKCKEDINYYYQKYYAIAIEKGLVIKAHGDNNSNLIELASKMGYLPKGLTDSKNLNDVI